MFTSSPPPLSTNRFSWAINNKTKGEKRGNDSLWCFSENLQRPWHEYEHNFQIMYKVGMGHKPPIPEKLSTEGKDFLGHCLESEPKRRWTASMLLDHPFVKVKRYSPFARTPTALQSLIWFCASSFRFAQTKSDGSSLAFSFANRSTTVHAVGKRRRRRKKNTVDVKTTDEGTWS